MRYMALVKTLIFLLVLLFLPWKVRGQVSPVPKRLDSLQAYIYSELNIRSGGSRRVDSSATKRRLNTAYASTCIDYPAIEKTDTVVINRNDTSGTLPSDFHRLHKAFRLRTDSLRIPMRIITDPDSLPIEFETEDDNTAPKDVAMNPRVCYTFAGKFQLHPKHISSTVDTFLIHYFAMGNTLQAAADTVELKPAYVGNLVHLACGLIEANREDYQSAQWYFNLYVQDLSPQARKERLMELMR